MRPWRRSWWRQQWRKRRRRLRRLQQQQQQQPFHRGGARPQRKSGRALRHGCRRRCLHVGGGERHRHLHFRRAHAVLPPQRKGEAAELPAPHSAGLSVNHFHVLVVCGSYLRGDATRNACARARKGGDADVGDRHGAKQHCGLRVQAARAGQGRLPTLRTTPVRPWLPLLLSPSVCLPSRCSTRPGLLGTATASND